VTSPHLSALLALPTSPATAALVAFLSIATGMIVLLLALNWRHRVGDRRQAHVRRTVTAMIAAWQERPPTQGDILWLSAQGRAGGRTALSACLDALAGLSSDHAGRVCEALSRSGLGAREIERLGHRDPWRRAAACRAVGRMGEAGAIPFLMKRLQDRAPEVRREAVRALGELRAVEAIDAIAETIETMGEWTNLLLTMAHGRDSRARGRRRQPARVFASVNRSYRSRASPISSPNRRVPRTRSRNRSCRVKYT